MIKKFEFPNKSPTIKTIKSKKVVSRKNSASIFNQLN